MYGQYGFSETFKNAWGLLMTKVWFPGARLVRRPFYLRGDRSHFAYGKGLTLGYSCRFETGPNGSIRIGENCKINDRVHISSYDSVTIGDNVLMASNIFISDNNHDSYRDEVSASDPSVAPDDRPVITSSVKISDNVWIGEGACVLAGVEIGRGGVIASNAVVTHDVPKNTIVAGTPARPIKKWNQVSKKWVRL